MQTYLNELLPSLQSLGLWGYWVIGLLAFGEALVLTSVFAPGTVVVVLGGALVAQGFYDFGDMIWFVAIGTTLGAEASFRIGARGEDLFQQGRRIFSTGNLERGKRFFAKYGAPSIILGHFFGPLRPVVPVAAGLSGMSRRRFFLWNAIGGIVYSIVFLSAGYFFGTAVNLVSATVTRAGLFALAVLLILGALWFIAVKLYKTVPFFVSVLRSVGQAIGKNPDVRSLVRRHPVLFRLLSGRLSREAFTGLPVTILATAFGYFLLLYTDSTLDVVTHNQIVEADIRIANLLTAFRDPALVRFFTLVTAFGYWVVVVILAVTASVLMWSRHRLHYLPGLWLTLIGNQLTVTLLKNIFTRPRPEMAYFAESSYSFPSGHSAASVAFYGFLTYVLIREKVGPMLVTFLVGATIVFLIGLSRIYLIEHYLSDVLNGCFVGAIWALLGIWLVEWRQARVGRSVRPPDRGWRQLAGIAVIVGAGIGVTIIVTDYQQTRNVYSTTAVTGLDQPLEAAFADGLFPTHSETIMGTPQEPISLIILAETETDFLEAISKAGWRLADLPGIATMTRAAFAVWFDGEYVTAPVTPSFWNGQPHDFGFQAETVNKSLRQRHHARFWRTRFRTADGFLIFVGTASFDGGLKWGLTHRIDPNIDAERDFVVAALRGANLVGEERQIQLVSPVLGQNLAGDPFFTDGKSVVLRLLPDGNNAGTTSP